MTKRDKFNSEDFGGEKKKSWLEHNQCQYTYHDKSCFMLGTSSGQGGDGGRYYCAYHVEIMHEESRQRFQKVDPKKRTEFNREHFNEWYKTHMSHGSYPDQFSGFYPDNEHYNPNDMPPYSREKESEIWNKINCGRGSW